MMKRLTRGEKIFRVFNYLLLSAFIVIIIAPIFFVTMKSFVSEAEIARRGMFIVVPEDFQTSAYQLLWNTRSTIIRAYGNTLWYVVVGTAFNMAATILCAYALSRRNLRGRGILNGMIVFTMLFGGGLIPSYLINRSLGFINSRWAMVFPGLIGSWNMFMMRNFFYAIPEEMSESAMLDGANHFQILFRIVLPCSMASIATIGLFYAVGHWNAWFGPMIYLNDVKLLPMQNVLRNIVVNSSMGELDSTAIFNENYAKPPTEALKSATLIVGTLPILVIYPFVQKYFVKGVMVGSLKG